MRISAAVLAAALAPWSADAFYPSPVAPSVPFSHRSTRNEQERSSRHMSYLDDLSNNNNDNSGSNYANPQQQPPNWGAPPAAPVAPAAPAVPASPPAAAATDGGIFPGSIFDVISAECNGGGGDGPSERGAAAVYAYLEAVAARRAVPSPPASALIAKYVGSLSPDGMTPDSAVAIAAYLESLSAGAARLPSAEQFAGWLNGIFMMDVQLPRSRDDVVAYFDGTAAPSTPPTDIAPYDKQVDEAPPAPKADVEEKAFPGAGGVWRTSSGKIVPPPPPTPKAPKQDLWKEGVLSEGDANVASEIKRIFFGGGLVFAGIAILAGTSANVVQNAETEIARDVDVMEQGAAKGAIKMEKELVKDMRLSPELDAAAKRAVSQQAKAEARAELERLEELKGEAESLGSDDYGAPEEELALEEEAMEQLSPEEIAKRKAARAAKAEERRLARADADRLASGRGEMEKDSADEYGSVAEESSSADADTSPAKTEEKRIAESKVAPGKARAKAAAKADRMRREEERAALEAGAADEYGVIDETKARASKARIDRAAAEAKARLEKAAAQDSAKKEKTTAPAPAQAPASKDTQAAEAKLKAEREAADLKAKQEAGAAEAAKIKAEREAATKVIAMPEGMLDQLKGGSPNTKSSSSFSVYSTRY